MVIAIRTPVTETQTMRFRRLILKTPSVLLELNEAETVINLPSDGQSILRFTEEGLVLHMPCQSTTTWKKIS